MQRARIVRKSTELKEVVVQRCKMFEVFADAEGRSVIRFTGENEVQGAPALVNPCPFPLPVRPTGYFPGGFPGSFPTGPQGAFGAITNGSMQIGSASAGVVAPMALALTAGPSAVDPGMAPYGNPLIHVELSKEQINDIEMELARAGGAERSRKICLQLNVQEEQLAKHFRLFESTGKVFVTHLIPELAELEEQLLNLSPRRSAILAAMVFCLEHAAAHAAPIAGVLVRSLRVPELETEAVLARFFLVSDVLFNTRAGVKGAARYRTTFEELLPDACESLGRQWLRSLERGKLERTRAEGAVKNVLNAWRSWDVFPTVFVGGLESLLLGPAPDDVPESADVVLRQKLTSWCSEVSPAEIPIAARRRGLSGAALPVTACRQRLCMYERYWHTSAHELTYADTSGELDSMIENGDELPDSIDGESLSDGDLDLAPSPE